MADRALIGARADRANIYSIWLNYCRVLLGHATLRSSTSFVANVLQYWQLRCLPTGLIWMAHGLLSEV
jgi:hypothetical protein